MPQRRSKELWEQFKLACDAVYEQGEGPARGREREVRRGRQGQGGVDRRGRGARRFDRLGRHRREAQGAAGAVEGVGPPAAQAGRRAVEAVPRRVRPVLRAPQAAARRAARRGGREPREEAAADRARTGRRRRRAGDGGWGKSIAEIKDLQRQWKEIGFVPRRDADAVYKAFRAACDSLFAKRDDARDAEANAHRAELDASRPRSTACSPVATTWSHARSRCARRSASSDSRELSQRVDQMVRHVIATQRRAGARHRARSGSRSAAAATS